MPPVLSPKALYLIPSPVSPGALTHHLFRDSGQALEKLEFDLVCISILRQLPPHRLQIPPGLSP